MLEAYSLNTTVAAGSAVPFNNVTLKKGNTACLNGVATIELNKCGVYMVEVNASSATASTISGFTSGSEHWYKP